MPTRRTTSTTSIDTVKLARRGGKSQGLRHVQNFLRAFGYLKPRAFKLGVLDAATSHALAHYQRLRRMRVTGEFDQATRDRMSQARCGMADMSDGMSLVTAPLSDFAYVAWDKSELKYAFATGTDDIAGTAEFQAVRNAFQTWSQVVPMTFREVARSANPDIIVAWKMADDSDYTVFPELLAHSDYPPRLSNNSPPFPLHFMDEGHTWCIGAVEGQRDVETTALHEIGHLLGLGHSLVLGSIMYPDAGPTGVPHRELTPDVIEAIEQLYQRVERRGDSGNLAGEVSSIAAIRHQTRQVVTAVRTGSQRLLLISWRVNTDGSVSRLADSGNQAGEIALFNLQPHGLDMARGEKFVTACRRGSGDLLLISWSINSQGIITRSGDSGDQAGAIRIVRIISLSGTLFVTACNRGNGKLLLISWRLNPDGSLTRLHDSGNAAGEVSEISLIDVSNLGANGCLTAVRNGNGNLQLILWTVSSTGIIRRRGDSGSQAGTATLIRAAVNESGQVITALRSGAGKLMVITWSVSFTAGEVAGAVRRLFPSGSRYASSDQSVGEIRDLAIMCRPFGRLVTAVRNGSNNLQILHWNITAEGRLHCFNSSISPAGEASLINLCQEPMSGDAPIVTSLRSGSGRLKLITWAD